MDAAGRELPLKTIFAIWGILGKNVMKRDFGECDDKKSYGRNGGAIMSG